MAKNSRIVLAALERNELKRSTLAMSKDDDDVQLYPKNDSLLDGTKNDEKKVIGPRLVRRLGGFLGGLARPELHMPDLAKPEGFKLISIILEKKGHKKDALDK